MVGDRDVGFIFLAVAFEFQEIIIAAVTFTREHAAGGGPGVVNRTAAFLGVKELADLAIDLIFLTAHDALVTVGLLEEFLLGLGERHIKMLGDAFGIAVLHFNDGVGAAVARTFHAIIEFSGHQNSLV